MHWEGGQSVYWGLSSSGLLSPKLKIMAVLLWSCGTFTGLKAVPGHVWVEEGVFYAELCCLCWFPLSPQVLAALLVLTAVAELALAFVDTEQGAVPAVQYTNPSLYIATWIMVLLVQDARRFCLRRDSGVLFCFWILTLLCGILPFQSLVRKALQEPISDLPRFILFFISYGLQLLLFLVSGFSDIAPETKEIGKKNPEVTASFLSCVTFQWYSSMVFKGYRKPLEIEDVWELKDEDKTKALYTAFEKNMKTAMQKARAELEKRKCKKRRQEGDPDHGNSMSKAQSQDILVLVNPFLLLALYEAETPRCSLRE
uniref:ABC transporter TMD0 domain-containing protein n=1 Tax=Taeniopygia guttata TaxID=59729 RepID=A0A674HTB8_TAEGU